MGWKGRARAVFRIGILLSTALAVACRGGTPEIADARNCFPEEARRWIAIEQAGAAPSPAPAARNATVYVDRSGSMAGYIAGATAAERPLQDLIGNLPTMLDRQRLSTRYRAFGTRISEPLNDTAQAALMQRDYYGCRGPYAADCDNEQSHFDSVFQEIRGNRSDMALVITDLWFSNRDIQTSALSALAQPLTQILTEGRAVAIYGISAPFDGNIYDLPYTSAPQPFRGDHPLFLIAVGSDAQIAALDQAMRDSPSPYLAGGLTSGRIKRALFTLNPSVATQAQSNPLGGGTDSRVAPGVVIDTIPGVTIQQLRIGRAAALRPAAEAQQMLQWTGPAPSLFVPQSVWQGEFETRTRVWDRQNGDCLDAARDWIEGPALTGLWDVQGGLHRFRLNPETVASELGREGTYLVTGELIRKGLQTPNPATDWLREWSFGPSETAPERATPDGRRFFPTLHVGEVARLMEAALSQASNRAPITGFAFILKVDG
jgi:hypothetical protein